jgi:DNA-binding response OmpR family regulator
MLMLQTFFCVLLEPIPGCSVPVRQYTREDAVDEPVVVLVVDDDTSIQQIVEETLSDGGFASNVASSAEEAIGLLNANRYRVLIIDVAFGRDEVKGWAVARRARAFNSTLPVIYITGGNSDEWSIHGVPNSILLTKPFAPEQLLAAVSELLNTGPSSVPRSA